MNAIPQERRRQFLDELAKITGRVLPPEEPIRAEAAFAEQDAKMFAICSALIRVEAVLADQDAALIANGL
jgi:glycerol kinase